MTYYKSLDSLRAFAVISVLIGHWFIPFDFAFKDPFSFWFKGLVPQSGFGVNLFFVLSGFLITNILLEARSNGNNRMEILKSFMIRRILRIFPIYYISILLLYIFGFPFKEGTLSYILLYISNIKIYLDQSFFKWGHTWSLSVEEQFYLFWPWVMLFVPKTKIKLALIISILVGLFVSVYTMKIQNNWAGQFLMPSCMQAFAIGGLYAYLKRENALQQYRNLFKFAFVASLIIYYQWAFNPAYQKEYNYLVILVFSIISIGLIHLALTNKSQLWNKYFFENKFINKIGKISYGIYLYHLAMEFVWNSLVLLFLEENSEAGKFLLNWKNSYYIKLVLVYFISLGSYNYIEKYFLSLKSRFTYS